MNSKSKLRRLVAFYFLIVDIPLAVIGVWGLYCIPMLVNTSFETYDDLRDAPPPAPTILGVTLVVGEYANILIGLALLIGYLHAACATHIWQVRTVNGFWWASFLYNIFEAIHNITVTLFLACSGPRFETIITAAISAIPTIGAILSFRCLAIKAAAAPIAVPIQGELPPND